MLKRVDRYLLREMALPFVLAVLGFLIFILLFLIGQFSQWLVERVIPPKTLLLLLLYKTPYLLVLALPVAVLFSIFLALGRLGHDREVIALQAAGISPRRVLLPLLAVGLLVSGLDLWMSDTLAPWGNQRYLRLLLEQLYGGQTTPQIRDHAFFKGAEDRFFYVRRYDKERDVLEGVLVYDLSGQLALQDGEGGAYPKVITAQTARWSGEEWLLSQGAVHAFDDEGNLVYVQRFATLTLRVGATIQRLFLEQRTPSELSLRELGERIEAFRKIGRSPDALIVEYHLKIAIPLAAFVFALFGAPLSLLIGPRGRALGVILSVLLVLLYQGVLFWTAQILGNRGDIPPAWGAWLPNLLFGLIGLWLFFRADRLGRIDHLERLRRALPLCSLVPVLVLGSGSVIGVAQEDARPEGAPIEIAAERLVAYRDGKEFRAEGSVEARYADGEIFAGKLALTRLEQPEELWKLTAEGARFRAPDEGLSGSALRLEALLERTRAQLMLRELALVQSASVEFEGGRLRAEAIVLRPSDRNDPSAEAERWVVEARGGVVLRHDDQNEVTRAERLALTLERQPADAEGPLLRALQAEVLAFEGETDFVNAAGETHRLRYRGERATLRFTESNEIAAVDIAKGEFTTCPCAAEIPQAAYSIRAERLYVRPDELVGALAITLRAFGTPVFWAPAYVAPLGDVRQKYPFLPEVGRDSQRGYFAKWRLPLFLNESTFGFLLLDYYSRYGEVGTGLDLTYQLLPGSPGGRFSYYRLVGSPGGEALSLDWRDSLRLTGDTRLDWALGLRTGLLSRVTGEEAARIVSRAALSGTEGSWSWRVELGREQNLVPPEAEPETREELRYRVLERLPELSIARRGTGVAGLPLRSSLQLNWGRYREVPFEGSPRESARADAQARLSLPPLPLLPGSSALLLGADAGVQLSLYERTRREAGDFGLQATLTPLPSLRVTLDYLYRAVRGRSPFRFDRLDLANRATLQGSWAFSRAGTLQWTAGYDRLRGQPLPLQLGLSQRLGPLALSLEGQLRPDPLVPERISGQLRWSPAWGELILSGGYRFPQGRWDDAILKLELREGLPLRLGARFDPQAGVLRRVNLQGRWELSRWELSLGGEYDFGLGEVTALQLGVVRKFCQACWQVGVFASRERVWFEARINAFPSAAVAYSPTDQALSFGD